jgi:hypothetical protein
MIHPIFNTLPPAVAPATRTSAGSENRTALVTSARPSPGSIVRSR